MSKAQEEAPQSLEKNGEFAVVDQMLDRFDSLSLEQHLRVLRWAGIINENKELTRDFGGEGDPPADKRGLPSRF